MKVLNNLDLNSNQLLNALIQLLGSDPGSPAEAQIWYDSTNHVLKFRNNSATITLGRLDQISAPTASVALNSQKITGLADPGAAQDAATQNYVLTRTINSFAAPTADFSMNSHKITGLTDGTASTDAATVGQVTAASAGLDPKASVRVATAAALAANTASGTGVGKTLTANAVGALIIDGTSMATNDRVLVKNESTGANNGIYTVTNAGGAGAAWVLTRATDFDQAAEVTSGAFTFVEEGTSNDNTGWVLSTNNPITVDTTALTFVKFSANTTQVGKYTATGPSGGGSSWTITHALGTQDVVAEFRDASTNAMVLVDWVATDTSTVTASFGASVANNALKVTVLG